MNIPRGAYSVEAMAQTISKTTDGVVIVYRCDNAGSSSRFACLGILGDEIVTELAENDVAIGVYTHENNPIGNFESLADAIAEEGGIIGLTASIFQNGGNNGANTFGSHSDPE